MKNINIVNNFDMEDIKENIRLLLPCITMPYTENELKGTEELERSFYKRLGISLIFAFILTLLFFIYITFPLHSVTFYNKIIGVILSFVIAASLSFLGFFAIWEPLRDRRITKENRIIAEDMITNASTLDDVCKIIDFITHGYGEYTKNNTLRQSIFDLRMLKKYIKTYLALTNHKVLHIEQRYTYNDNGYLLFDLLMEDNTVQKEEIPIQIIKSTTATGKSLVFTNWEQPAFVKKYKEE